MSSKAIKIFSHAQHVHPCYLFQGANPARSRSPHRRVLPLLHLCWWSVVMAVLILWYLVSSAYNLKNSDRCFKTIRLMKTLDQSPSFADRCNGRVSVWNLVQLQPFVCAGCDCGLVTIASFSAKVFSVTCKCYQKHRQTSAQVEADLSSREVPIIAHRTWWFWSLYSGGFSGTFSSTDCSNRPATLLLDFNNFLWNNHWSNWIWMTISGTGLWSGPRPHRQAW